MLVVKGLGVEMGWRGLLGTVGFEKMGVRARRRRRPSTNALSKTHPYLFILFFQNLPLEFQSLSRDQ